MSAPRQAPCWLTVAEVASYLHCRKETVREAIASGALPAYRRPGLSAGTIVHTNDVDAYVRENYDRATCPNAARRAIARADR